MKNLAPNQNASGRRSAAKREYVITFRCYYEQEACTRYVRTLSLKDLQRWIQSYEFTHPNCRSISFGVWLQDERQTEQAARGVQTVPELLCEP